MVLLKRIFRTTALAAFATVLVGLVSGEVRAEPARSWTLESQSGQVNLVKPGIAPVSLTTGDVFSDGDWIETGPDGRALLRRGEETIVVAPNSRIGLPKNNNGPYATRILQTLGTILLTVEKKAAQHFQVETPYLTAVVKGTTFTVGIQDSRAVVHVVEGLVEVKSLTGGGGSLVRPGQTGSVLRGGGDVEISGGDTSGTQAQGASPVTAPAASQASPLAIVSESKSRKIRIVQALGPTALDLSQSTEGLLRAAHAANAEGVRPNSRASGDIARGLKASKSPKLGKSVSIASSSRSTRSVALARTGNLGGRIDSTRAGRNDFGQGKSAKKPRRKAK